MSVLKSIRENTRYMQYLSALTGTLPVSAAVMYVTWSSPTLPKLVSDDSPIGVKLTSAEASWVASSFLLGGAFGGLIAGWILNRVGRKGSLLLCSAPLFFPWLAIMYARSAWTLCIARFIAGIASTVVNASASIYNGEIAENDIRGKLGTTLQLMNTLGGLFVLCIGPFTSYKTLAICCSVVPVVFVVLFYFMPESPYYVLKDDGEEAAQRNLEILSAKNVDPNFINGRLQEIKCSIEYDMKNKLTFWKIFTTVEYRKSLTIMIGIKTLQQFSGTNAIAAYMQTIIASTKSSISPELSSIIFGLIQVPAVLVTAVAVDKYGRKPLFIISGVGCAVALLAEGIYFYLQDVLNANLTYITWLPTTSLVFYLIMNTLGILTLPYVLLGEIFATNLKAVAVAVFSLYAYLLGFVVTKCFDPISSAWGMHTMFWIYAFMCILGVVFVIFALPETKGKTFAEIQEKLK